MTVPAKPPRLLSIFVVLLFCVAVDCVSKAAEPPVTSLSFSPEGDTLVACSQSGVSVLQWPSLNVTRELQAAAQNLHCAVFSPAEDRIAIGGGIPSSEGLVEVFSWPELNSICKLDQHSDSVTAVVWQDDQTLVSASLDHEIVVWDLPTKKPKRVLKGHSRGVMALSFLKQERSLVSTGIDQSLRVWNAESTEPVRSHSIHTLPVHDLQRRPGDHGLPMIASASEDRSVRLWQPTIGRMVRFARLKSKPMVIAWTADGSRVVAACTDGRLRVINPDTVKVERTLDAVKGWAYSIAVHPDGTAVVGGEDGQIKLVQIETE